MHYTCTWSLIGSDPMFVSYVMNEILWSCLIDLTAVSGIWIKCTTHARGRSHVRL